MHMNCLCGRAQKRLDCTLNDTQITQLLGYHALIQKWNKVYNLTAIRDPAEMLTHHLLDSLAIVAPLRIRLAGLAYEQDGAERCENCVCRESSICTNCWMLARGRVCRAWCWRFVAQTFMSPAWMLWPRKWPLCSRWRRS